MIDFIDHSQDKPIKMKPWEIMVATLMFGLILVGVICEISAEPEKPVVEKVEEPILHLNQAYDAFLRTYRIDKVCYDKKTNGYFVHFDPEQFDETEEEAEKFWSGWHYTPSPTFLHLEANNTWYISGQDDLKRNRVYIDTRNLSCAEKKETQ